MPLAFLLNSNVVSTNIYLLGFAQHISNRYRPSLLVRYSSALNFNRTRGSCSRIALSLSNTHVFFFTSTLAASKGSLLVRLVDKITFVRIEVFSDVLSTFFAFSLHLCPIQAGSAATVRPNSTLNAGCLFSLRDLFAPIQPRENFQNTFRRSVR